MNQTIGLIGVGNMGTAIVEGLFKKNLVKPSQVMVFDKLTDKAQEFSRQWKTGLAQSSEELASKCEVILLAVKPQDLAATASEMKIKAEKSLTVISILAGVPLSKFKEVFGPKVELVRAMPNLGAKVGESMTAITATSEKASSFADQIFSGCGKVVRLEEKFFDLVTAVSGSGPAYFFLLMELLEASGRAQGLSEKDARLLAIQTALGSALLAASADVSPEELRKRVTSKGGTTEAALNVFNQHKIADIVSEAVKAAVNRGKELAKG